MADQRNIAGWALHSCQLGGTGKFASNAAIDDPCVPVALVGLIAAEGYAVLGKACELKWVSP